MRIADRAGADRIGRSRHGARRDGGDFARTADTSTPTERAGKSEAAGALAVYGFRLFFGPSAGAKSLWI
jgi:hypothetical protein